MNSIIEAREVWNTYMYIGVEVSYDEEGNITEYLDRASTSNCMEAIGWQNAGRYGITHIDAIIEETGERLYSIFTRAKS